MKAIYALSSAERKCAKFTRHGNPILHRSTLVCKQSGQSLSDISNLVKGQTEDDSFPTTAEPRAGGPLPRSSHPGTRVRSLRPGSNTRTGPRERTNIRTNTHAGQTTNSGAHAPHSGTGYRRTNADHTDADHTDAASLPRSHGAARSHDSGQTSTALQHSIHSSICWLLPHLRVTGGRDHHLLGRPRAGRAPDRVRRAYRLAPRQLLSGRRRTPSFLRHTPGRGGEVLGKHVHRGR